MEFGRSRKRERREIKEWIKKGEQIVDGERRRKGKRNIIGERRKGKSDICETHEKGRRKMKKRIKRKEVEREGRRERGDIIRRTGK